MLKKILIVEDNPQNLKLIQVALGPHGYTLLEARDGEQALRAVMEQRPDLILMDIQLPKMSGIEVTERIKQMPEFSRTPIIAVTSYASKEDEQTIIKAGCDAYLAKPVDVLKLPGIVAEIMQNGNFKSNSCKD